MKKIRTQMGDYDQLDPSTKDILNDLAEGQHEINENFAQMYNMMVQLTKNNNNNWNYAGNNIEDDGHGDESVNH